jgi:hypothetical protein
MNIKTFIATAVIALTAACTDVTAEEVVTETVAEEATVDAVDEAALDANVTLGENERPD